MYNNYFFGNRIWENFLGRMSVLLAFRECRTLPFQLNPISCCNLECRIRNTIRHFYAWCADRDLIEA